MLIIKKYNVDGIDNNKKIIYEYNGDFWHGNPNYYKSNNLNKILNITFGDLYQKTFQKEKDLISAGYTVVSIWESDFYRELYKTSKDRKILNRARSLISSLDRMKNEKE